MFLFPQKFNHHSYLLIILVFAFSKYQPTFIVITQAFHELLVGIKILYVPKNIEKVDIYNIPRAVAFRHAGALATELCLTKEPRDDLVCSSISSFKESHM